MSEIIPAHGHGRLRPFPPGVSGNPGGRPRALAEAVALARSNAPAMVRKLIELANASGDDRVQAMAAIKLLEIAGAQHLSGTPEAGRQQLDLSSLAPEQRAALDRALATVRRLLAGGPEG